MSTASLPFFSNADLARVRPALHDAAEREKVLLLSPNLAQALALLGGPVEVRVLLARLPAPPIAGDREEQIRIVMLAEEILRVRPSLRSARALVEIVRVGVPSAVQHAGWRISMRPLAEPPLPVQRVLQRAIPLLMKGDDDAFAMAFPILFRSHFHEASTRAREILSKAPASTRRILISRLNDCGYRGLPLLLDAFRGEPDLELRPSIARSIAPALAPTTLGRSSQTRSSSPRLRSERPAHVSSAICRGPSPDGSPDAELASLK